jgi:hypothetical protein
MDYENDTAWVCGMLHPGENLLWTGKPGKGHLLRKEDLYLIPFSLMWFGFAVIWEALAFINNAPLLFKLWGIPFVLAGLYFTAGRFVFRVLRNKKSRYALTGQRILVRIGKTCKTLDLSALPRMIVTQRADGSGDIRFGESVCRRPGIAPRFGFENSDYLNVELELLNIPDVNQVEYRIRSAAEQVLRAKEE